jgi:hypothetical protein
MSVTFPSDRGSDGFEDIDPIARTLDQCDELKQLRDAVLQLHGFAQKERELLQQVVADELWRQRRQLITVLALLVLLVASACVVAAGGIVLASGAHGREVYHKLGIASQADLEALRPQEEMNVKTLNELALQLHMLAPKVEAFTETSSGMAQYLRWHNHDVHGSHFLERTSGNQVHEDDHGSET